MSHPGTRVTHPAPVPVPITKPKASKKQGGNALVAKLLLLELGAIVATRSFFIAENGKLLRAARSGDIWG